jgi:structural maintenance of chromosome 4
VRQAGEALQQTQTQAKDQNYTVKAILDAAARGQLPGVIGRIGDLGWIPPKYDVAATTSGLGGLNAILVEKY